MSRPNRVLHAAGYVALLVLALFASSCAILDPPTPRHGGDGLSTAAQEAKKKPEEQTTLVAGREQRDRGHTTVVVGESTPCDPDDGFHEPHSEANEPRAPHRRLLAGWHLGMVAGATAVGSGDFETGALYGLRIGARPAPRLSADLALYGAPTRFAATSGLNASFRDAKDLVADASVRYSLMPDRAFMAIAPIAGFQFGSTLWRYRNPLSLDRDGETVAVSNDWLDYYAPYAGVAIALVRTPHFEVGAAAVAGYRFYDDHSQEGLRNDLFRDSRFMQLRLETRIPF